MILQPTFDFLLLGVAARDPSPVGAHRCAPSFFTSPRGRGRRSPSIARQPAGEGACRCASVLHHPDQPERLLADASLHVIGSSLSRRGPVPLPFREGVRG